MPRNMSVQENTPGDGNNIEDIGLSINYKIYGAETMVVVYTQ